jgi:Lambda phage tail tube protein, TTP
MASQAIPAAGTKLYRGDTLAASPSVPSGFTSNIPELKDFTGPSQQNNEIDVTSLDSTAREFRPALKDNGSFSCNFNLVPNHPEHIGIQADGDAQTVRWWRLQLSEGSLYEFAGYVQTVSASGATDGVVGGTFAVRISGGLIITPNT